MYQNFLNLNKLALLFALCFSSFGGEAQNLRIDSLKLLLGKDQSVQFEILYSLGYEYIDVDNSLALQYGRKAYDLAVSKGDSLGMVKSTRVMGAALRRLERICDAIEISRVALDIAKRNGFKEEVRILLNSVAVAHILQGEYDKALYYNFQSLVIREAEGNKSQVSIALNNIGLVYFKLRNYEKALEYYYRSLQLKKESNDNYDLDRLYNNIGLCHIYLNDFKEALKSFDLGFKICGNNCAEEIKIEGECSLGIAYYGLKNYAEAEKHFTTSLDLARKSVNNRFQAENLLYLGRITLKKNNFKDAQQFLEHAELIADSSGYNQLLIDVYREFSNLFNLSEDYQQVSFYQKKYITLKDSLIGEELVKNIAKTQTNFAERANIATIADREEALTRQRKLNLAIGIIAALAALLGFVLYRSNSVIRKSNKALSAAKAIIETQNLKLQNSNLELDGKVKEKTAELEKAVVDLDKSNKSLKQVNDELDNFIYKTSHDIRGPLASLKGICSVAMMDVRDPLALNYLNKLDISSGRLNVILTRLLIVNQINNAILGKEPVDFKSIVEDVILLEKKKGLPARFEIRKDIEPDITLQSDKDLVRIILENLIDNAIKFHNDSERANPFVHIKIGMENGKGVSVSVVDNGIGIKEAKPDKIFQMFSRASERSGTGGIGLYLSKLATEKLGGQIHLRTTPEGYTEFFVSIPSKMPVA